MLRIPTEELERLKAEISGRAAGRGLRGELKAAGKDLLGRCPFHEDREASLVVTPAKNLWHCFSCQIGGGPIDWMMKSKGVSFRHAVELLREGALDVPAAKSRPHPRLAAAGELRCRTTRRCWPRRSAITTSA
jgi:DNA primase